MEWHKPNELPEVGSHIIIRYVNDLGWYFAAGIVTQTTDTREIVFADVLAGHIYDWQKTVLEWAYI